MRILLGNLVWAFLFLIIELPLLILLLWMIAPYFTTKIVLFPFKKEGLVKKIYNRYVGMEKGADETKVKKFNLNQIIEEIAPNNTYIWFYNCESFAHYVYPAFKKKMEAIFNSIKEDEDCYIELYEDREFPKNFTNYKHFIYSRPIELMNKGFEDWIDCPYDYIGVTIEDFCTVYNYRIRDLLKPAIKYSKDEIIKAILTGSKKDPCLKNLRLSQNNSLFYSNYSYKDVITCINETAYWLYLNYRKNLKKNHVKPKNIYFTKNGITHNRHLINVWASGPHCGGYLQYRKANISYTPKNDLNFAGDEYHPDKKYLERRGIEVECYKKFRKKLIGDPRNFLIAILFPEDTEISFQQWYRCVRFYRGSGRIIKADDKLPDKYPNLEDIPKVVTLKYT